ncbi:beta/gamma crystallin-related protein [Bradyrhizobium japonicum]|uniref:beta/gamma crystallin-related protein n=1 Tax=Bradyrhizobium japonicum TaxID=375 RepID=UPI0005780008|nr:beta/gamma crystallin-related protein [Bradyrhizobium japonicum]
MMKTARFLAFGLFTLLLLMPLHGVAQPFGQRCATTWRIAPIGNAFDIEAAKERLRNEAHSKLHAFATDSRFFNHLASVYGFSYDRGQADGLRHRISAGDFGWVPEVVIVSNEAMPYAASAFSEQENRIYLNRIVLGTPVAAIAYLEEVGHYLDSALNERDTAGDEGEHFMRLVTGQPYQESARLETGIIVVDGRSIEVEFGFLGDMWDAVKDGADWTWDGLGWTWEQVESATDWVVGGMEDTWDWARANINLGCVGGWVATFGACGVCAGTFLAAPETGGASLLAAKQACGLACVGSALWAFDSCAGSGTTESTPVPMGRSQGQLKTSTVLHPRSLVRLYDGLDRDGDWQAFPLGTWDVHSFNYLKNDRASSLEIDPGLVARVCTADRMSGDCWNFHQGQKEDNWFKAYARALNNRTSSLSVTPGVTVYEHRNFEGKRWTYGPGRYKSKQFKNVLNDQLSSLITAPGVIARLCADRPDAPNCITVDGDQKIERVPTRIEDQTSHISVFRGVTVYEKGHFDGLRHTFLVGTYSAAQLGPVGNDNISSLVVSPGLEARVCSESGGSGKCRTFRSNVSFVGQDLDNSISWIRVTRSPHTNLRRPIGIIPVRQELAVR